MPRAHGLGIDEGIFHLTRRCHNRHHLLKFARDRNASRSRLGEALGEFEVALLDDCLTSNHVHLLVDAADRCEIRGLMHKAAGGTARAYNRRKGRLNAFWGNNDHATVVEGDGYPWRCLVYIELNMVGCGVVTHPEEWGTTRKSWGGNCATGCSIWSGLAGVWRLTTLRRSDVT